MKSAIIYHCVLHYIRDKSEQKYVEIEEYEVSVQLIWDDNIEHVQKHAACMWAGSQTSKSRQVILQNSKQNKNAYMRLFLTKGESYVENDSLIFLKSFDEVNEELSYNL